MAVAAVAAADSTSAVPAADMVPAAVVGRKVPDHTLPAHCTAEVAASRSRRMLAGLLGLSELVRRRSGLAAGRKEEGLGVRYICPPLCCSLGLSSPTVISGM